MQTQARELWCSSRARKQERKLLKGVTKAIKGTGLTNRFWGGAAALGIECAGVLADVPECIPYLEP